MLTAKARREKRINPRRDRTHPTGRTIPTPTAYWPSVTASLRKPPYGAEILLVKWQACLVMRTCLTCHPKPKHKSATKSPSSLCYTSADFPVFAHTHVRHNQMGPHEQRSLRVRARRSTSRQTATKPAHATRVCAISDPFLLDPTVIDDTIRREHSPPVRQTPFRMLCPLW